MARKRPGPWPWENTSPKELVEELLPGEQRKTYDAQVKKPERLSLNTERDLRNNIRNICQRLNDTPELARMLLVNPVLALEDAGVEMTPEVKQHIIDALRFPASLQKRRAELEVELGDELAALGVNYKLPLTQEQRAHLLFHVLKLEPHEESYEAVDKLTSKEARALSRQHPLAAKLAEYERARQGRQIFYPREVYETYKAGLKRHNWIKSVKFNV
jgi:hypothetical protein